MLSPLELTIELCQRPSVTPDDAGCQHYIASILQKHSFHIEHMPFGQVNNLWATHGQGDPLLVFLGHTDVVPTGDVTQWTYDPFTPTLHDGKLYARGSADMKGGVAAMVVALQNFVQQHPNHPGSIALLLTSDEEGDAQDGVKRVVQNFQQRQKIIDWCIVGEPSSQKHAGDQIRIGRRGSLHGHLTISGIQGHTAYPNLADNPIHRFAPFLVEFTNYCWDTGNENFPATVMQISNLHSGTGVYNVIPGTLQLDFNFRYGTSSSSQQLMSTVEMLLQKHHLQYQLHWKASGEPFLTPDGKLRNAACQAIQELIDIAPHLDTGGGTSDGRFIAPLGTEVIELGPVNASIHKVDEHVDISDLDTLTQMYTKIIEKLLIC